MTQSDGTYISQPTSQPFRVALGLNYKVLDVDGIVSFVQLKLTFFIEKNYRQQNLFVN